MYSNKHIYMCVNVTIRNKEKGYKIENGVMVGVWGRVTGRGKREGRGNHVILTLFENIFHMSL